MTKVIVVIPTLNEAMTVDRLLQDLLGGAPADLDITCVVVDGGSSDGTQARVSTWSAQDPRIVLLDNPKRIQSAGVNLAARNYGQDGGVLVRCDAHEDYPTGFLEGLVRTLAHTAADSVVVPMDSVGRDGVSSAVAWAADTPLGSGGSRHRGGRLSGFVDHGHHAAFKMERFLALGGYDETFTHNEDAEYDCRLSKAGGKIYMDADLRIVYHPRSSLPALAKQYRRYGRGRARTVRRHPQSLRLRQMAVPVAIGLLLAALLLSPLLPALLLLPGVYLGVLAATSLSMAIKRRSPYGLLTGPAAGIMHVAWAFGFAEGLMFDRPTAAGDLSALIREP